MGGAVATASHASSWFSKRAPLALGLLLVLQFLLRILLVIGQSSATPDELFDVATGHYLLKTGEMPFGKDHAPLPKALAALPLLPLHLDLAPDLSALHRFLADPQPDRHLQAFGRLFFFANTVRWEVLLFLARLSGLFWALLGSLLLTAWATRLGGDWAGLLALALFSLDPTVIAHASVAGSDVPFMVMALATLFAGWSLRENRSAFRLVLTGLLCGMTFATKYPGIFLLPLCAAFLILDHGKQGILPALALLPLTALGAWAGYGFHNADLALDALLGLIGHTHYPRMSYFLGEYRAGGWWTYFLVAAALKTPLPTLALLAMGIPLARRGTPRISRPGLHWLWVPALVYFAIVTYARIDIGVRYLLPIFPPLFILAGVGLTTPWSERPVVPRLRALTVLLLAWLAGESVRYHPHYIPYFNQLAGGPDNGWRYLSDSNVDWGQALPALRQFMKKERIDHIYLSYFGGHVPDALGIRYQGLPDSIFLGHPMPMSQKREFLAISVVNRQAVLKRDHDLYRWLDDLPLKANVGYSIHVFDITGNAQAHLRLADLYQRAGRLEAAERERRRAAREDLEHVSGNTTPPSDPREDGRG